ncbi:hypothetical protein [Photobacterium swingsii]|uniref:hypothetical protein n=1 Tax=Photobacterium swingsii TaxID=680026 RepID=UPI0040696612
MNSINKLALAVSLGLTTFASAATTNINSLQGYYKTRATIDYVSDKMMQNKVDFFALDYALHAKGIAIGGGALQLDNFETMLATHPHVSDTSQKDVLRQIKGQFGYKPYVCKVADSGAVIVFEVDDAGASCKLDPKTISKAMAKNTRTGKVTFFTQLGNESEQQYLIDTYLVNGKRETISSSFLHSFKGQLIGDVTKVTRDNSTGVARYNIEQYADYGSENGQKIAFKSYQWTSEPLNQDNSNLENVAVNTFMVMSGKANQMYDNNNNTLKDVATYWATRDVIGVHKNSRNEDVIIVDDVQRRLVLQSDSSVKNADAYNSESKSNWLDYNFNNIHDLTGESPDACMIKEISEGKPVVRYKGWYRSLGSCQPTAADIKGKEKVIFTTFTTGQGKQINVKDSALVRSAKDIIDVVDSVSNSVKPAAKIDDKVFAEMKAKYEMKEKEFAGFSSLQFWK